MIAGIIGCAQARALPFAYAMTAKLKRVWILLRQTISSWSEDRASRLAAALAYYTVFSIAPLLVIVIAIAGLVFGREAATGQIQMQIQSLVGPDSAKAIQTMIQNAGNMKSGLVAGALGILALLFGAAGVFGELQDGLNTVWEVKPKPGRGIMGMLKDRFSSFAMVLGIAFILMVSLIVSAGLAAANQFIGGLMPAMKIIMHAVNFLVSFGVITLLFAMIFKVLPDVKIAWRDVWIGAVATALLFTIGKFLIGLYLGQSSIGSAYGAAGSLVIILVWVYYSSQILFLGAEFTQVYAEEYGSRIVPAENAQPVTKDARAQQGMAKLEHAHQHP